MEQVAFGAQQAAHVSEMCLGTMMFGDRCDSAESDRILSAALDAGVTFVDTAAMYCDGVTEEILGSIMGDRREKIFLGTKVHKGVDGDSIETSIDESLKRLKTDYVDLYMIHWPQEGMRPTEIMEALAAVVASGKARFVGCCNYPAWLLAHSNAIAAANGWPKLAGNQVPYNLIERGVEVEVLPQAMAEGIAITTYRPLVMGLLAGKYRPDEPIPDDSRGKTDDRIQDWLGRYGEGIRGLIDLAEQRGLTPAQVATAWVRKSPAVTCPVVGVSSQKQLEDSIKAFEADLSDEEYARLTGMFDTEVKEESGGRYKPLRRELHLLGE